MYILSVRVEWLNDGGGRNDPHDYMKTRLTQSTAELLHTLENVLPSVLAQGSGLWILSEADSRSVPEDACLWETTELTVEWNASCERHGAVPFQCECCRGEVGTIQDTLPDVSIAYKLHLECGRIINLYDWLQVRIALHQQQQQQQEQQQQLLYYPMN